MTEPSPHHAAQLVQVSTEAVPPAQRLSYWADWVCTELIRAQVRTVGKNPGFEGRIERAALPALDVCRVQSTAQSVARTAAMAADTPQEHILVNVQRHGIGYVSQDGKTAKLLPGDLALYSSARPYTLDFEAAFDQTVLILPAQQVHRLVGPVDALYATTLGAQHSPSALLCNLADTVMHRAQTEPNHRATRQLGQALLHTLAAAVESHRPTQAALPAPRSQLSAYHRARLHAAINQHLADPQLGVDKLAALTQLSPGHIHRLFETEAHTVAATIRLRRLEACRADLADPDLAHHAIGEIAYRWGFNQAAHFSRLFKQAFGLTPGEWRAQQRPSQPTQ